MDLNNYWQENKRFVTSVGVGVALFAIAWYAIDSNLGSDVRRLTGERTKADSDLKAPMLSNADLTRAKEDNQALLAACSTLRQQIEFVARPEFRLEKGVAATNRYFSVLERVRDDLRTRAGRAGLSIPEDLGMPAVAPTKEIELGRHIEALDLIDQIVHLSIEAGAERLDTIRVKLDPRLLSGKPFDDLERTLVELKFVGDPLPLTRLLVLLQEQRNGRALMLDSASIEPARTKTNDVVLEFSVLVAHLNRVGAPPDEEGERAVGERSTARTAAAGERRGK